jgi:hypothetical protein
MITESKPLTLDEFLDLVKVFRMLYTIEVATRFFEENLEEFTGYSISDLQKLLAHDKLAPTHENI